jgi:predicted ATPase
LVLEDIHGLDAATRQLAEDLLGVTDVGSFMLALTMRPEPGTEGWQFWLHALAEYKHRVVEIPLEPLSMDAGGQLADALSPTGALDSASKNEILTRAEGNPLYLEELLRALVETGGIERRTGWTLSVTALGRLLPPPLESLLVTRIRQLSRGPRRIAQVAAVIGREFPLPLLERVAGSLDLREDLAVLLRSEVIRELRRFPQIEYTFHHGLIQEAALSTVPPQRARELYGRVASAFEEMYAETVEDRLELLAFYSYRSDAPEKALRYLERAGKRAAGIDAPKQATELWGRALRIAEKLGDPQSEDRLTEMLASLAR